MASTASAGSPMVLPVRPKNQWRPVAGCGLGIGPSGIHATRSTAPLRVDNPGRRDRSITRGHLPWATMFNAFGV